MLQTATPITDLPDAMIILKEMQSDGVDLFCGYPELGSVLISEPQSVRLPLGLGIERDRHWTARKTLNAYADEARKAGRIVV